MCSQKTVVAIYRINLFSHDECLFDVQRVMSYLYPCRLLSPLPSLLRCRKPQHHDSQNIRLTAKFVFLRFITFHYTKSESRHERFEREFPRSTPNAVLSVLRILRFSDSYPVAVTYRAFARDCISRVSSCDSISSCAVLRGNTRSRHIDE